MAGAEWERQRELAHGEGESLYPRPEPGISPREDHPQPMVWGRQGLTRKPE